MKQKKVFFVIFNESEEEENSARLKCVIYYFSLVNCDVMRQLLLSLSPFILLILLRCEKGERECERASCCSRITHKSDFDNVKRGRENIPLSRLALSVATSL